MPYEVKKDGDNYLVINSDTGDVKAKHDSKEKADAQIRLLEGIEHGMVPRND
jgi:hypothetical protein